MKENNTSEYLPKHKHFICAERDHILDFSCGHGSMSPIQHFMQTAKH